MARHANLCHIELAREWMPAFLVPTLKLIENGRNVLRPQHQVIEPGSLLHRREPLRYGLILPNRVVASRMLHEHRNVAPRRPMLSQKGRSGASAAQSVAE